MKRTRTVLALVAAVASWCATGLSVALYGAGMPFALAALVGAVCVGAAVWIALRRADR